MNYAITQTSGKQFFLKPGQWYDIDFIRTGRKGDFLCLKKILLVRQQKKIQLGQPFLEKAEVPARIIQTIKGKKLTILKTKPKKHYTRTRGYRSLYTRIQIQ